MENKLCSMWVLSIKIDVSDYQKSLISRIRKPICYIVFCVMSLLFRSFKFLVSVFCVRCCSFQKGAIHEVETRYSRKEGEKRSCKYFNAFIVHVM